MPLFWTPFLMRRNLPATAIQEREPLVSGRRSRPDSRPKTGSQQIADGRVPRVIALQQDSQSTGEVHELSRSRYTLGRYSSGISVPHDAHVARQHAEVVRVEIPGGVRWLLRDLHSPNGTFVRVQRTILREEKVVKIGDREYQLRNPESSAGPSRGVPSKAEFAELSAATDGARFSVNSAQSRFSIGSGNNADFKIIGDRHVDGAHAAMRRDASNQWCLEDNNSRTGIWVRVSSIPLRDSTMFQLGRQRFVFRLDGSTTNASGVPS